MKGKRTAVKRGAKTNGVLVKRETIAHLIRQVEWCNHWIKLWKNGEAVWEQTKDALVVETDRVSRRLRRLLNPTPPRSRTSMDEWDAWEAKSRQLHPWRWFFGQTVPSFFRRTWRDWVHEPWYWLKCRVWHRYNVVVCQDLPPTWNDRDDVLLHAAFQCLKDYVEREDRASQYHGHTQRSREELIASYHTSKDPAFFDDEQVAASLRWAGERADEWLEVRALYDWWEVRRKQGETPIDPDEEHADYDHDSEMLCRLAKVRGHLWS